MKRSLLTSILIVFPGIVCAGWSERFALSAQLADIDIASFPLSSVIPLPVRGVKTPSPEWITAVKKAYVSCPQGGLPPAAEGELPAAALRQLQWDLNATSHPSKAYKATVEGRAAFVIENDNSYGLFVNIFDRDGVHIAYGGFDENYDFCWLTKAKTAAVR